MQARQVASDFLTQRSEHFRTGDWVLTHAEEYEAAWAVGYQSRDFLESGNIEDSLAGNGPAVVPKSGAAPWAAWSGHPVADQVARGRPGSD
jgi:Immunity protein 35